MSLPLLTKPSFDHHPDGFGIGNCRPRISWRFLSTPVTIAAWTQTSYEIQLERPLGSKPTSYHVESDQNVLVPWPAEPLESRQQARIRVRCVGRTEITISVAEAVQWTEWSPVAVVEAGLLNQHDLTASFIASSQLFGPAFPLQPVRFQKTFDLPKGVELHRSRLYITCLGVFEACLNGQKIGDECMAPGWTSYTHRLNYRVFDVGPQLLENGNVLSVEVGEGWYAGKLGFRGGTSFLYGGTELAVLCQLEVDCCEANSGHRFTLLTDETWTCMPSAIVSSEIYNGETYDMRFESPSDGFEAPRNSAVKMLDWPRGMELVSPDSPPVRVRESRKPRAILTSKSGKTILDFGQNLVGKLHIHILHLPAGATLVFRHAEVLERGELGTRPLGEARCEDTIISSGKPLSNWTPKFTFHGFRYVEVDGWLGDDESLLQNISAQVIQSDIRRRGYFSCSNASVNQLHENIVWSMRGNFVSVPTDCPQRDERLGWTGDLAIFAPSAMYLYDAVGMLGEWLQDLACEQLEESRHGIPGLVCPDVPLKDWPRIPQAIWHDVTILLPNTLYTFSNDTSILRRQFHSMQAWLEHGVDRGPDRLWSLYRWQLGDWLDPTAPPQQPALSRTDSCLVADAYLVHVTAIFARICTILNETYLASKYTKEATALKCIFQSKYITLRGNLMSNTQTALSLVIRCNLYPHSFQLTTAAEQLAKSVRSSRFHIATGFAGTPEISHALTSTCQPQLAYRMLLEKTLPSWIYPITMGATTVWERWDSMLPDGTINPGRMTSFNHYAQGAVANWLHASVAGLSPVEPGWKVFRVRPVPGGNLSWAAGSFDGPYGVVACKWWLETELPGGNGMVFKMDLTVPPNSRAVVTLPSQWKKFVAEEGEEVSMEVKSGEHHFGCPWQPEEWPPKPLLPPNIKYSPEMDDVAV